MRKRSLGVFFLCCVCCFFYTQSFKVEATPAPQITYYVDCCDTTPCSSCASNGPTNPFNDIQDAIDCCTSSATYYVIKIKSDTCDCYGELTVGSSHLGETITLEKWGTIRPTIKVTAPTSGTGDGLDITRRHVVVNDIDFECVNCTDPSITPPFFSSEQLLPHRGIFCATAGSTINPTTIEGCAFKGFGAGLEMLCVGNAGIIADDNEIEECTVGVILSDTPKKIRNNDIHDNYVGIFTRCGDRSTINGNYIHDNGYNGIRLDHDLLGGFGCNLQNLYTKVKDNVIIGNGGLATSSDPLEMGSGITVSVTDFWTACHNDPPMGPAENLASIYNNIIAENTNGIIMTCGSSPTIENNLIIENDDYGIFIDNDATRIEYPDEWLNIEHGTPDQWENFYQNGDCMGRTGSSGHYIYYWKHIPKYVCYTGDITSIFNMNTIDSNGNDGMFLDTTARFGFYPNNEPSIDNSIITSNTGYGVQCAFRSSYAGISFSYDDTFGNTLGHYHNCFCLIGSGCQYEDPDYVAGDYPDTSSGIWTPYYYADDYYLEHKGVCGGVNDSPCMDRVTGNPWNQPIPLPYFYTICNLNPNYADTSPWDIGFHYQNSNWYE